MLRRHLTGAPEREDAENRQKASDRTHTASRGGSDGTKWNTGRKTQWTSGPGVPKPPSRDGHEIARITLMDDLGTQRAEGRSALDDREFEHSRHELINAAITGG